MIQLTNTLSAWGTSAFEDVLRQDIEHLGATHLPLQQGLSTGSYALDKISRVMMISATETDNSLRVKAGIFYASLIAGCSCADDPTPVEEISEYCEIWLDINKSTAETNVTLVTE